MVNSKVEEYIKEICSYVKFKKAHKEIRIEFLNHIEEKTEDLMLEGMNEEEASKKALVEMGQAEIIGKQLNQSHKATPEWTILIITVLFSLLGLVTTYHMLANEVVPYSGSLSKNVTFNIIGYISILGVYFFDYKKLEKYPAKIFIGISVILLLQHLFAAPVYGRETWLTLGPLSVNTTELSLFLYVISLSKLIRSLDLKSVKGYVYLTLMLLIPVSLYIMLKVSMEIMVYLVVFIMFMFISKVKLAYLLSVIGTLITGGGLIVLSAPYQLKRILIFTNPESDPTNAGYLYIQIKKLLASVGFKGNGFTFPKRGLPIVDSDLVLTYIIYTFGWIAGITLIILVLVFIARMVIAAKEVKDIYGRFLIWGFMCIFAMEFIWNILMILGFAPIVSVTLPFISYGGSRTITQMSAIGIIMSIYKGKSLSYARLDSLK
ncbi:FtsW/RodA/SpoVE family cell cycle protein [Clostridium cibarium]|uniref:FtsW/RodA/SpoVE family cell cycle protein n=1 Tax=Clostridium cibarium TaxID=2762247 RepID=A0ABR8PU01_9CLOT|nr:FtsW/RodA/SpoVE family cell cycle protein [Clostridium cibarium]MBD7911639.1 FtsW/RodA/SpoVE family cell cycle protein [Clostridium cibarium]